MSRRASSVYQFFQYKEELRTAKISALVIVVAFLCWGPFFINLALLTLASNGKAESELILWLHHASNLTMLGFAALSPYLYVFRSSKVQNCLGQVLTDTFCCKVGGLPKTNNFWQTYRNKVRKGCKLSDLREAVFFYGLGNKSFGGKILSTKSLFLVTFDQEFCLRPKRQSFNR